MKAALKIYYHDFFGESSCVLNNYLCSLDEHSDDFYKSYQKRSQADWSDVEAKQMWKCAFYWRVKFVFGASEKPLTNGAGDDEILTTEYKRSEPCESDEVDNLCDWWAHVVLVKCFVKCSIIVMFHFQVSGTFDDQEKV